MPHEQIPDDEDEAPEGLRGETLEEGGIPEGTLVEGTLVEEGGVGHTIDESAELPRGHIDPREDPRLLEQAQEGTGAVVKLVAGLMIVLVLALVGAVMSTRPSGAQRDALAEVRLKRVHELLEERRFQEALEKTDELLAEDADQEEAQKLRTQAQQGLIQEAFQGMDPVGARKLIPEGWDHPFPELPWILALTGDAAQACEQVQDSVDPAQRARLAAWGGQAERCAQALDQLQDKQRARALRWELRAYLPGLKAPASDLVSPAEEEGWPRVAQGEEALAQGYTSLAALDFDDAMRDSEDEALRLQASLGLARVALARGDTDEAGDRVADAFLLARQPLDRARCLGWASLITVAADAPVEAMAQQLGDRSPLDEAKSYAPGAPLVATALRNVAALERLDAGSTPDAAALTHWGTVQQARDQRRAGETPQDPALAGPDFSGAERDACARGLDGVPGLLLARGCDLATLAEQGGSRDGATRALQLLALAKRLRPTSPAVQVATARAHRLLHEGSLAVAAAERALLLAPGDPQALLQRGLARRAALESDLQEAGEARLGGSPHPDQERELAGQLQGCLDDLGQAVQAAGELPLGEVCRLEQARTQLLRGRLLAQAGDGPGEVAQQVLSTLAPLLQPIDVSAVAQARAALLAALAGGDDEALARAEFQLGRVAGDLPARALLGLRRSERLEGDARREEVARARALAPTLPALRASAELLRAPAQDARSFRELSAVIEDAPEWHATLLGVMYWSEGRLDAKDTAPFADGDEDDPLELLARAAYLRSIPVYGEHTEELTEEEQEAGARLHDRVSREGAMLTTRALQRLPGSVYGHLLRAMLHSSMGRGAPLRARGEPRSRPDVTYDLACARAGAPWASAVFLYHLHWQPQLVEETVAELAAQGFTTNYQALLNNVHKDVCERVLRPAAESLEKLAQGSDPQQVVALGRLLKEAQCLPSLGLALGIELADRLQPDPGWLDLVAGAPEIGGEPLFGPRPQVELQAEARLNLALAQAQGDAPALLREAGPRALRALEQAQAAVALLPLHPRRLRALEVRASLPKSIRYREFHVAHGLPTHTGLWSSWYELQQPEDALEWLAAIAEAGGVTQPGADPWADLFQPWSRARAWVCNLQESHPQARAVSWLLKGDHWEEALATTARAAAFARGGTTPQVFQVLVSTQLRPYALATQDPAQRTQRLQALAHLVARAVQLASEPAALEELGQQLQADLRRRQ